MSLSNAGAIKSMLKRSNGSFVMLVRMYRSVYNHLVNPYLP